MTDILARTGRLVSALAILAFAVGCGQAAPAVAMPTATVMVPGCPLESAVCSFAELLDQWIAANEVDALLSHAEAQPFDCPWPPPQGSGGPYPLCDGSGPGERRMGYPFTVFQSEGNVYSEAGARAVLLRSLTGLVTADPSRTDEFGPGTMRLFTIGCPAAGPGEAPSCSQRFAVVFSGIQELPNVPRPFRSQLIVFAWRSAGTAVIDSFGIAGAVFESALLRGGAVNTFPWAYGKPPTPGQFFSLGRR